MLRSNITFTGTLAAVQTHVKQRLKLVRVQPPPFGGVQRIGSDEFFDTNNYLLDFMALTRKRDE
jgi:hypothetical protein